MINLSPEQQIFIEARKALYDKIKNLPLLMYDEGFACEVKAGPTSAAGEIMSLGSSEADVIDAPGWGLWITFSHRDHDDHRIKVVVTNTDTWDLIVRISSDLLAPDQVIQVRSDMSMVEATAKRVRNIFVGLLEGVQSGLLNKPTGV